MPPGILNGGVAVNVGEQAKAESVAVVGGIREAIDEHAGGGRLEGLPDAVVELVVNDGAPVLGLLVGHGLHVCTGSTQTGHRGEGSAARTQTYLTHVPDSSGQTHVPKSCQEPDERAVGPIHISVSPEAPPSAAHDSGLDEHIGLAALMYIYPS